MKLSFLGPHNGERVRYLFRQNADHQPLAMILIILSLCGRPHREVPLERVTGLESKIMSTEAASILEKKAASAKGRENFYMRFWRVLGWIAQVSFISGFAFLVAFAAKNT